MPNRLAEASSPYLLQHADNPVDWWPWCDEALTRAREDDKPILLSVGYSACHWCHVMAHESFEDDDVAALMNARYVNIKVDREERPDLDKVYQLAHQILTQRPGGWPLTVVLEPRRLTPFMAGTYFPRDSRLGMPAFPDVLRQVADWYDQNKHQLEEQKERLDDVLARLEPSPAGAPPDETPAATLRDQLERNFDSSHGGFTGAPKFPHPPSLDLLFGLEDDEGAREMARFSLARMCAGGLFDHLGGGFFRYCVDESWTIPHFEKMLYDNALLLATCAQAGGITGEREFREAAERTVAWARAEMRSPKGAFYASLDADSDGVEGGHYVWDRDEIRDLLGDDYPLFAAVYGLDRRANFEERWHLQRVVAPEEAARQQGLDERDMRERLDTARATLHAARTERTYPHRDEKILTAWNALMIRGLARTHRALDDANAWDAARSALDALREGASTESGLRPYAHSGGPDIPAYLDDVAFLLDALLEMLQCEWNADELAWATRLADDLIAHYEDAENGGFYFTAHAHERLIHRPKPLADESTPAGNAVAARALLRLGWLIGEPRYLAAAERTLAWAREPIERYPLAHTALVQAATEYRRPPALVVLRGEHESVLEWRRALDDRAGPGRLLFPVPADARELPAGLADKAAPGSGVLAYVCRGTTCEPPIASLTALGAQLQA